MANEKRLIDADALKDRFRRRLEWLEKDVYDEYTKGLYHGCYYDITLINEQPTVDTVPVVHGRWEQVQRWATKAKYRCSVCGREIMSAVKVNIEKYPYCHCGAKMDGDGNA